MNGMTPEAIANRAEIQEIRYCLLNGSLTYEEARARAEATIVRMNVRGAEIARKNGFKYRPLTFAYLMR